MLDFAITQGSCPMVAVQEPGSSLSWCPSCPGKKIKTVPH